jgi:hypothetical protein
MPAATPAVTAEPTVTIPPFTIAFDFFDDHCTRQVEDVLADHLSPDLAGYVHDHLVGDDPEEAHSYLSTLIDQLEEHVKLLCSDDRTRWGAIRVVRDTIAQLREAVYWLTRHDGDCGCPQRAWESEEEDINQFLAQLPGRYLAVRDAYGDHVLPDWLPEDTLTFQKLWDHSGISEWQETTLSWDGRNLEFQLWGRGGDIRRVYTPLTDPEVEACLALQQTDSEGRDDYGSVVASLGAQACQWAADVARACPQREGDPWEVPLGLEVVTLAETYADLPPQDRDGVDPAVVAGLWPTWNGALPDLVLTAKVVKTVA